MAIERKKMEMGKEVKEGWGKAIKRKKSRDKNKWLKEFVTMLKNMPELNKVCRN
jgi:transketolase